jgi:hypothetical protein
MQSMGLAQWEQLVEAATEGRATAGRAPETPTVAGGPGTRNCPLPRHFPGGVNVEIVDGVMALQRSGAACRGAGDAPPPAANGSAP